MAERLRLSFGADVLSARGVLAVHGAGIDDRDGLQRMGSSLERRTRGGWLAQAVASVWRIHTSELVVVDSARTQAQLLRLRKIAKRSISIHLIATRRALVRRFNSRLRAGVRDAATYALATADPVEADQLRSIADHLIDTTALSREDVFRRVLVLLRQHGANLARIDGPAKRLPRRGPT